jgi:hypothetical protein
MIGYEQNGHSYCLLDVFTNLVFVGTHLIFDKTATGPPLYLLFAEKNNYTDTIVLTEAVEMQDAQGYVARCRTISTSSFCLVVWSARDSEKLKWVVWNVDVTNDDNIVVQPDDDSVTSDDQFSNANFNQHVHCILGLVHKYSIFDMFDI